LGLIVTSEGFPLWYQIFEGNKFEGHTFIPIINEYKQNNNLKSEIEIQKGLFKYQKKG